MQNYEIFIPPACFCDFFMLSCIGFENTFFYKNTWIQFQPAVSYFSVYFQPQVFLILILVFINFINFFQKT